jgi:hypothetical protein
MQITAAIEHYGSITALADALELEVSAICNWRQRTGELVPELYARRLDDMTGGALRFEHEAYGLPKPARRRRVRSSSSHRHPQSGSVVRQGGGSYHS